MNLKSVVTIFFVVFLSVLLNININHHEEHLEDLKIKTEAIVEGLSAPRGRILDRNGKVLVDNVGVLNIVYHKNPSIKSEEELEIAKSLANYVKDFNVTEKMKKNYYLVKHNNGDDLITADEYRLLEERKISKDDILNYKLERIPIEALEYTEYEQKIIYLYSLMNEGYYYQDKYLLKEVSEEEALKIMESDIPSLKIVVSSKRVYPYNDTLRDIFGSVGSIPKEDSKQYVLDGYNLEDVVGISGLEKTYEDVLKGEKATYLVNSDYSLDLVSEEKRGNDLVLNIDIDLQLKLESELKNELVLARNKKQSRYFHDAYSIIGEPLTGNILAMSGIILNDDGSFKEITGRMLSSSFAMGSVVKGASSTVGYKTGAITVGQKLLDSCVKLYYQPSKCSYKRLGYVDDITALKTSSNYFQFVTAIKTTGNDYHYNMELPVTKENFNTYRDTFASYGLGSLTNIDLPNEKIGMIGETISGDLLLNLSIGQYDTYTPVELFQYINTIANRGKRLKLNIAQKDSEILNEVELDQGFYDRILEGFYEVFHGGTASSYANPDLQVSGKTGTSETFYDSNNDGVVDVETINSTLALFYPRNEPKYSMVIIAPNITNSETYTYPFTKNISLKMTNYLEGLN